MQQSTRRITIPVVMAASAFVGMAAAMMISMGVMNAHAETASTTSSATSTSQPPAGPHMANGKTEETLTGDTKTKAVAAAEVAESGATVIRAETDAEGAMYEVHMRKSDGSMVTVSLDGNFKVTSTETGMGPGGPNQ